MLPFVLVWSIGMWDAAELTKFCWMMGSLGGWIDVLDFCRGFLYYFITCPVVCVAHWCAEVEAAYANAVFDGYCVSVTYAKCLM